MVWLEEEECRFATTEGTELEVLHLLMEPDELAPEHEETIPRIHSSCFEPSLCPPLPDLVSESPGCKRTEGPLHPSLLTRCLTLLLVLPPSFASETFAASGFETPGRCFPAGGPHGTSGCVGLTTLILNVF